jgi:hypothetical protein
MFEPRVFVKRRHKNLGQFVNKREVTYFRLNNGLLTQVVAQHIFGVGAQHGLSRLVAIKPIYSL